MWMALIFGLAIVMIIVTIISSIKEKKAKQLEPDDEGTECKTCNKMIPSDFDKALCPHCKNFIT
ncbi:MULTISPECIES: hypothetical protein [Bacillaceae]|uniref:Uncharacterized protein n=1 Tax=Evansella alkalicola TaxID=745819 RepID=A0ABS6JT13_9BACI|nr:MULTISPECIES: hypothetical protein [Bacillaceae]MBU9721216.1 hypothetical protein [Bacillus alkalicola]